MSSLKDTLSRIEDEVAVGRLSAMATFTRLRWIAMDLQREVAELAQQRGDLAARVLELEAEVSRLTTRMTVPTVEPDAQHWAGMDGAMAFHLIERHADNWADTGRMMGEWLAANQTVNVASDSQPSEQTR